MKTWSEQIKELAAAGLTYSDIAVATGSKPSTIGDLATERSKSPRWDLAMSLRDLHASRCPAEKAAKPAKQEAA